MDPEEEKDSLIINIEVTLGGKFYDSITLEGFGVSGLVKRAIIWLRQLRKRIRYTDKQEEDENLPEDL